jgi:type IV pilus assembly protein PilX
MNRYHNNLASLPARQRGIVLIIALIMLVAMTTIGVSSITTSSLEERMAGNFNDRNIALQAAEAALREGERYVQTNKPDPSKFSPNCNVIAGLCDNSDNSINHTIYWDEPTTWSSSSKHMTYSSDTSLVCTTCEDAKYIIEHMGYTCPPGEPACYEDTVNNRPNAASGDPAIYRITAIGYGMNDSTKVMLQSTYLLE